jgi:hypothetical protein
MTSTTSETLQVFGRRMTNPSTGCGGRRPKSAKLAPNGPAARRAKARLKAGLFFFSAYPDRGHRPVRRHRAVRR